MYARLTKVHPETPITKRTGGTAVVGEIRMYPPIVGDSIIVEQPDHPGGGIMTSRVESVHEWDEQTYFIITANSIYKLEQIQE